MIPLIIYQTWHTKKLPAEMRESVNQLKKAAPEFTYMLFDDADCLEFIQEYFPPQVVEAYHKLIPGAYKADLWRYCALYVTGGIYIDIKYRPVPPFKLIQLTRSEHFVNDLQDAYVKFEGVYNGVMVCKPQNKVLLKCINEIVHNATVTYFGRSPLEPTGPILLRKHCEFTDMQLKLNAVEQLQIFMNGTMVLYSYLTYRKDQRTYEIYPHYSRLWMARAIYRRTSPEIVCAKATKVCETTVCETKVCETKVFDDEPTPITFTNNVVPELPTEPESPTELPTESPTELPTELPKMQTVPEKKKLPLYRPSPKPYRPTLTTIIFN